MNSSLSIYLKREASYYTLPITETIQKLCVHKIFTRKKILKLLSILSWHLKILVCDVKLACRVTASCRPDGKSITCWENIGREIHVCLCIYPGTSYTWHFYWHMFDMYFRLFQMIIKEDRVKNLDFLVA